MTGLPVDTAGNGPRFAYVPVLDHEIHVTEWGDPSAPPLVMWHGLARTGRDFDETAAALSDSYFVLCPDTIGRGLSSWSENPEAEHSIEYYAGIAVRALDGKHIPLENGIYIEFRKQKYSIYNIRSLAGVVGVNN